ncbi:OmpA family protein [Echinicola vietnamensis]|uniref:Outer membrane protein/peptidoglycan-associated (Lipo)protein n=1 Tax=Echinicola vietnamensis (strain DSM 17526 / LMG 23754 / KMM 6221) TaxID=926556 RepID=L0G2D5_ECHVK|nr:OmpA family protein [Echinicola vietnamensis]AGA79478.1 outer membrane protein/peptidoglycan-associated (lipo)protein [Echinicola vietnamensis DSM 17526]
MMKQLAIFTMIAFLMASCANWNNQQKGTAIGAASGAAVGAAVSKGSVWGVLAGAAIGGTAGNLIGRKMDQQAKELQQAIPTAEVNRVNEGINVTFDASLAFKINSAALSDNYKEDLLNAIPVFQKYPDTNILIEGHTDDTGSEEFNMQLSQKRANAVAAFLADNGVDRSRLTEKWYGESQPKYPNDSEENRIKNRRVEMAIYANEEMKEEAKTGEL